MTVHRRRAKPAKGYHYPTTMERGTRGLMVRLDPDQFARLRDLAHQRRVPMAAILREVVADWLLRGPVYEPPTGPTVA